MTKNYLPTFHNQVADFVQKHDLETSMADRLLDLVSEVGEVAKEILTAAPRPVPSQFALGGRSS
ncbi:MAG: hypothetical protein MAG431_01563 [Chloroflexi bacterium]|nr:hypothetical protein [Chloroflexota bacterium]